jgi:hypothetical protein
MVFDFDFFLAVVADHTQRVKVSRMSPCHQLPIHPTLFRSEDITISPGETKMEFTQQCSQLPCASLIERVAWGRKETEFCMFCMNDFPKHYRIDS